MPLLCNRFRGKTKAVRLGSKKNIFDFFTKKIWRFEKKCLPLHHFPLPKIGKTKKRFTTTV